MLCYTQDLNNAVLWCVAVEKVRGLGLSLSYFDLGQPGRNVEMHFDGRSETMDFNLPTMQLKGAIMYFCLTPIRLIKHMNLTKPDEEPYVKKTLSPSYSQRKAFSYSMVPNEIAETKPPLKQEQISSLIL